MPEDLGRAIDHRLYEKERVEFVHVILVRDGAIESAHALGNARGGNWVSMGVPSDGSYGIPEGVIYGYPVTCEGGKYKIVKGLQISEFGRARMDATLKELQEERDGIGHLIA